MESFTMQNPDVLAGEILDYFYEKNYNICQLFGSDWEPSEQLHLEDAYDVLKEALTAVMVNE